ncbi:MAG: FkbM family methyltransferase [Chthoniobacterales bacterium]
MRRFLKRYFARVVPGFVRASVKARADATFNARANANFMIAEMDGALRCKVALPKSGLPPANDSFSFLAPLSCKDQLVHFTAKREERPEFESVARAARNDGGILFDIGAHSGVVSALFCAANPHNRVFSFEPSPILVETLAMIRELNGFGARMHIEQIGIGQATKTEQMLLDPVGGFVQVQRFAHTMWGTPQSIPVKIERISDAATRLGVTPQFIKLDVEGYENEAVAGAQDFLAQHKPVIFLELHLNYLEQRNLSARVVVEMLGQCGYRFYTCGGSPLKAKQLYDSPLPSVHVVAR